MNGPLVFFSFFSRELMHVDDAVDELRDKEKMNYIEAQVPSMSFYPDFIQILSRFYPDLTKIYSAFIQIF